VTRTLGAAPDPALHPAVAVGRRVGLLVTAESRIEVLEDGPKSTVFRLSPPSGVTKSFVLKRCAPGFGEIERAMYERVLPALPVGRLEYFGSWAEMDGTIWLALEDAGDAAPVLETPESRAQLTRWIANLHLEGARISRRELPDRGCGHFARRLRESRAHLVSRLESNENNHEERRILDDAVRRCDQLESVWPCLEAFCGRFPRTLVHGDFVEENLRVVNGRAPRLVPLDWEKAGWAVPAIDLVRVDPDPYYELTGDWLCSSQEELERLVAVGQIFRVLVHRWARKPIRKVAAYAARIESACDAAGFAIGKASS
jgi:hypothetical protein